MGSSCQKYLEGVNVNPNNATDASLENMMTSSMVTFLGYNEGSDARMAGRWAQQFTGSDRQYAGIGAYQVNTGDFDFFDPYIGVIQTNDLAIVKADDLGNRVAAGSMKLLKAATFGYVASEFGDAPFTEANNYEEYPNPVYDPQATVYSGVLALLDEAIADLQSGVGGMPVDIFSLTNAQWAAVANTYKARYYLHMGDYTNAVIAAGNGIALGGDMIGTHGTAKGGDRNMWFDFMIDERGGYLTAFDAYLPSILDPANPAYSGDAKTDESARFAFSYDTAAWTYDAAASSQIYEPATNVAGTVSDSEVMFGMTSDYPLITFAENQLILGESLLKIGSPNKAGALAALNAVRAELRTKFPGGTYDDYVDADFPTTTDLLNAIIMEKYKSLIGQTEAWNDMNRLNNPFGLTPIQGTQFPQRFLYPQSEVNANSSVPDPLPDLFVPVPANM